MRTLGLRTAWLVAVGIVALSWGDVAFSITCTDCRDLQKQRSDVQVELARKERELDAAVTRKDFRKISSLRSEVNQLRVQLLNMRGRDEECAVACRPDVIKEAECFKLLEDIAALESGSPEATGNDASQNTKKGGSGGGEDRIGQNTQPQVSDVSSDTAKIDELYKDLARCHRELKRLKEIQKK